MFLSGTFFLFTILYFLPLTLIYSFFKTINKKEGNGFFFASIVMICLSFITFYSLKNLSYGDDFYNYYLITKSFTSIYNFAEQLTVGGGDLIFWFFLFILSKFDISTYGFGITFALIFTTFLLIFSSQYERKVIILSLFLVLFSRLFLESSINPLRSSIALCFMFFSIKYFYEKRFIISIFLGIISFFIHDFIVLLTLLLLPFIFIPRWMLLNGVFITFVLFFILNALPFAEAVRDFYNESIRYNVGELQEFSRPTGVLLQMSIPLILPVLMLYNTKFTSGFDEYSYKFLLFFLSFTFISIPFAPYALRYFIIVVPIAIYLFFKYTHHEYRKMITVFVLISGFNFLVIIENIATGELFFDTEQSRYIRLVQ